MTSPDSIGCTRLRRRLVIGRISAEAAVQHAESGRDRQMRPDFDGVKRTSADFALEPAELGITDSRNHDPERSCSRLGTLARLRRKIKKNQRRTIIYNYHYIISELQQPMATELLVT